MLTPYGEIGAHSFEYTKLLILDSVLLIFTLFYCCKFFVFRIFATQDFVKNLLRFLVIAIPNYFITLFSCVLLFFLGPIIPAIIEYYYFSKFKFKQNLSNQQLLKVCFIINYTAYIGGYLFFSLFLSLAEILQ